MLYRLVTGWYPSRNTVERIFRNVNSKKRDSRVLELKNGFTISLYENTDYEQCRVMKEKCLEKGIYCGIEVIGENEVNGISHTV